MKKTNSFLILVLLFFVFCCESENREEKFFKEPPTKITGELAWYKLDGNLDNSADHDISLFSAGEIEYVSGLNEEFGQGLSLNGSSYLFVNLGYYDTIALAFWIKGAGELSSPNKPVLFDYGLNSISASLDGSTGATMIHTSKGENTASSEDADIEALNSFNRYSFLYFEAGGDLTRIYFKGYYSDGTEIMYDENFDFPGIIDPKSEVLYIGRSSLRENQGDSYFKGKIDEIHIYNKPLTDNEIESLAFRPTN